MFVYISFTSVYTIESAVFTRPQALHMDTAVFPQIPRHFCQKHLRRDTRTQLGTKEKEKTVVISPSVEREREIVERESETGTLGLHIFNTLFAFFFARCTFSCSFSAIVGKGSGGALSGDSCDDALCPKDAQQVVGLPCQGVDFLWVVGFSCIVLACPWPASVFVSYSQFYLCKTPWQLAVMIEGN